MSIQLLNWLYGFKERIVRHIFHIGRNDLLPWVNHLKYRCRVKWVNPVDNTLTLQKLRMPQIQGVRGEAVVALLRTLDNTGDVVSSAFPLGK